MSRNNSCGVALFSAYSAGSLPQFSVIPITRRILIGIYFPFQAWMPSAKTRVNHVNFNELLLCCEQHGGSDVLLEFFQVSWLVVFCLLLLLLSLMTMV